MGGGEQGPGKGSPGVGIRSCHVLTSTGGQCDITVSPATLPCKAARSPGVGESGSASYIWIPWWGGVRPGGLRDAEPLENPFGWFVLCLLPFFHVKVSEGT